LTNKGRLHSSVNDELELIFISGKFLVFDLDKDKEYLLKYFRTPLQQAFIQYYMIFGAVKRFMDHTGYVCNPWWLRDLKRKLIKLETAREKAKKEMDLDTLTTIETGKFKTRRKRKTKRIWPKPK
jgi:hypothetical protein